MKSKPTSIDPDKLRARIRQLGLERAFLMLDEALGMLSRAQLLRLAKQQIHRSFTQSGATNHRGRGTRGTTGKMPFGERSPLV
jgi:hypothetical protein